MKTYYQLHCRRIRFGTIRIVFVLSLGVIGALLSSCTSRQPTSRQGVSLAAEQAVVYPEGMDNALKNKISQIHVGMTFEEVAQIMPIYTNGLQLVEHGGIWFNSPGGTSWIVMLRFENPSTQPDMLKRTLNWQPVIRARIHDEASW